MDTHAHILGCLLGTAVGDAIGLPREGLSRRRAARMYGERPLRHGLLGSKGMCSDDTEHTVMVALALVSSGAEPQRFAQDLAGRLRWWLVRIPAGIGLATLRACLKLWLGFGPSRSGVRSAGNGPAMRSALLGLVAETPQDMAELVRASTRVTHTDPRAEQGAAIVAAAARLAADQQIKPGDYAALRQALLPLATDEQLQEYLGKAIDASERGVAPDEFTNQLGLSRGVSGFVNHTVPVAIYCWLVNRGDFRAAVETAVCLGGDSDTVGAIVGAISGTEVGPVGIPKDWLDGLAEWPCSVSWMTQLASALAETVNTPRAMTPPRHGTLPLVLRNIWFTCVVLVHGLRRLLPPY